MNPPSMLTGLANRISGLTRWHGYYKLPADFNGLKLLVQSLQWEFEERDRSHWFRQSQRQGSVNILPMDGFLSDRWLRGDQVTLAPLLALG